MESVGFDKSQVYTALNADELRVGDKVIVADNLADLRDMVIKGKEPNEIRDIIPDYNAYRFKIKGNICNFNVAYLIEKVNNCINCNKKCYTDRSLVDKTMGCINWEPEIEKPEPAKYRPFKDIDELIKVWCDKGGKWQKRELTMPFIWVRDKHREHDECLIIRYDKVNNNIHIAGFGEFSLDSLFECFEFLDGTPCGV